MRTDIVAFEDDGDRRIQVEVKSLAGKMPDEVYYPHQAEGEAKEANFLTIFFSSS